MLLKFIARTFTPLYVKQNAVLLKYDVVKCYDYVRKQAYAYKETTTSEMFTLRADSALPSWCWLVIITVAFCSSIVQGSKLTARTRPEDVWLATPIPPTDGTFVW